MIKQISIQRKLWSSLHLRYQNSVVASRRISGGAMLLSTGSHGSGVDVIVPDIVRIVELSCVSTRFVCEEHAQTGAQYSAAEYESS